MGGGATINLPHYEFVKSSKNTEPGMLITHECLRYQKKRQVGDVFYFRCTKSTSLGCTGNAVVNKIQLENEVRYILSKWTNIEDHTHEGDYGSIIAEKMFRKMTEKLEVRMLFFYYFKNILVGLYFNITFF